MAYRRRLVLLLSALRRGQPAITGPVALSLCFCLSRPKAKNGGLTPAGRRQWPDSAHTGDLSNYVKQLEDALETAGIIGNDAAVVRVCADKRWAGDDRQVGVSVLVQELANASG